MQETEQTQPQTEGPPPRLTAFWRRFFAICSFLIFILLVALLPPLITVNRFQRRIATSISASLGRPVHLDNVSLTLLPLPGFTLENFVVDEDPAFGNEPVIRSNSVHATLRVSSLWTRQVEFSSISFTDPSVNLVHLPDGRWNLQSILLQAAHIEVSPTAQRRAGPAPRFPYIEATGARVNLKQGVEKTPFSLIDADFALWLPNPQEWHIRLEGHPGRTDTNVTDTGVVRLEGTLGHAASLNQVALNLEGQWSKAPLGEASRLLTGKDAGLRGEVTVVAKALGTLGSSSMQARVQLDSVRRADFVPDREPSVDIQCLGTEKNAFHSFENVRCRWPQDGDHDVELKAEIPDIRRPYQATVEIASEGIPTGTALDWLHVASSRLPADIAGEGLFRGRLSYEDSWDGELMGKDLSLKSSHAGLAPLAIGDVAVTAATSVDGAEERRGSRGRQQRFALMPISLDLGGQEPVVLEGSFDASGYSLHLAGLAVFSRLLALGTAIPQFGDGLKDVLPTNRAAGPVRIDLTATRAWGGEQVWQAGAAHPVESRGRRPRR